MFSYRVTKYDPSKRNERGHYMGSEWTSIYDIDGKGIKAEEYIKVESSYASYVDMVFSLKNGHCIVNEYVEHDFDDNDIALNKKVGFFDLPKVKENGEIQKEDINKFTRNALRENCGGYLSMKNKVFVYFGYDYYMYVVSEEALEIETDLYVEDFKCPYHAY